MVREQGGLRCADSETPRPRRRSCCCSRHARPSRSSMSRATARRSTKRVQPATGSMTASAPRSSRSRPSRTLKPRRSPPRRLPATPRSSCRPQGPPTMRSVPATAVRTSPIRPASIRPGSRPAPGRRAGQPARPAPRARDDHDLQYHRPAPGVRRDRPAAQCGGAAAGSNASSLAALSGVGAMVAPLIGFTTDLAARLATWAETLRADQELRAALDAGSPLIEQLLVAFINDTSTMYALKRDGGCRQAARSRFRRGRSSSTSRTSCGPMLRRRVRWSPSWRSATCATTTRARGRSRLPVPGRACRPRWATIHRADAGSDRRPGRATGSRSRTNTRSRSRR